MRKVGAELVGREVTTVLGATVGLFLLSVVGPFLLANWFLKIFEVGLLGWMAFRLWVVRDWVSDLAVDHKPAEPMSFPLPVSGATHKEPMSIRLDAPKSDSSTKLKILLSSEKKGFREKVAMILQRTVERTLEDKVEVLTASTARETLSLAIDHVFHLVILDAEYTGDLSFTDLHTEIKRLDKSIPVVLLTEMSVFPKVKVDGFFQYPFQVDSLKQLLAHLRRPSSSDEVRHRGNKIRHI